MATGLLSPSDPAQHQSFRNSYTMQQQPYWPYPWPQPLPGQAIPVAQQVPAQQRQPGKHRWAGKRKRKQHDDQATHVAQLEGQNRQKARKHFQGAAAGGKQRRQQAKKAAPRSAPRTAPRAPQNTTSYIINGHAQDAEGEAWSDGAEAEPVDADADASIDFFGTNQGRITVTAPDRHNLSADEDSEVDRDSEDESGEIDQEDDREYELRNGDEAQQNVPPHVAVRLQEQASYILQLEDENLNLRDRIFLLQRQLEELQNVGAQQSSGDEAPTAQGLEDTAQTEQHPFSPLPEEADAPVAAAVHDTAEDQHQQDRGDEHAAPDIDRAPAFVLP